MSVRAHIGMQGRLRYECAQPLYPHLDPYGLIYGERPGTRRVAAPWHPNTVLNSGRNQMAVLDEWLTNFHVGTGNTEPVATDTALEQFIASSSVIISDIKGAETSPTNFAWRRITARFPVGSATGNLQEGGAGWGASGSTIVSRALIVNGAGEPVSATVLNVEFLDLTYELRYYMPQSDVAGTLTFDKVYDTTIRAAQATSLDAWANGIGLKIQANNTPVWLAYDDNIGTILQAPSGATAGFSGSLVNSAYQNNSYKLRFDVLQDGSGWVFGTPGIRSIMISTTAGRWQMQLDAQAGGGKLPKTGSISMGIGFEISWADKV